MPRMRCKLSRPVAGGGRTGRAGSSGLGVAEPAREWLPRPAGVRARASPRLPPTERAKLWPGWLRARIVSPRPVQRARRRRARRPGAAPRRWRRCRPTAPARERRRGGGAIGRVACLARRGGLALAARRQGAAVRRAGAARPDPRSGWRSRSRRGLGGGRSASRRRSPASGPARSNFRGSCAGVLSRAPARCGPSRRATSG